MFIGVGFDECCGLLLLLSVSVESVKKKFNFSEIWCGLIINCVLFLSCTLLGWFFDCPTSFFIICSKGYFVFFLHINSAYHTSFFSPSFIIFLKISSWFFMQLSTSGLGEWSFLFYLKKHILFLETIVPFMIQLFVVLFLLFIDFKWSAVSKWSLNCLKKVYDTLTSFDCRTFSHDAFCNRLNSAIFFIFKIFLLLNGSI